MAGKFRQKGRIPRTNTAIVLVCLSIIGAIIVLHIAQGRQIGIDLYGFMLILFAIVFALLDYAGVKILRAMNEVRKAIRGEGDHGKKKL